MPTTHITNSITNFTCDGKCSNCGECCSAFLPLNDIEISSIKKYIKANNIKPFYHTSVLSKLEDGICPFRDNERRICTIYKVRPQICRSFICSKPTPDIEDSKRLCYQNRKAVNMWKVFFNEGLDYTEFLIKLLQEYESEEQK